MNHPGAVPRPPTPGLIQVKRPLLGETPGDMRTGGGFESPQAHVMNLIKRAVSTPAARRNLIDKMAGSVVFAVAAWQSYGHTVEVARANGEAGNG